MNCGQYRSAGFTYDEETEEEVEYYELYYFTCYSTYASNDKLTIDLGEEFDVQSVLLMYIWEEDLEHTEA